MNSSILKPLQLISLCAIMALTYACNNDVGVDPNVETRDLKGDKLRGDAAPCFEIVYPVTLVTPNGELIEVNSKEEWHDAVREWKENNPDAAAGPKLQYPIEVIKGDALIFIESEEAMKQLKKDCDDKTGRRGQEALREAGLPGRYGVAEW